MNRQLKVKIQIYDLLFYLLLVFSFYFTRNLLCRLMMVAFFGYTVLLQIGKRRKAVIPFYCVGNTLFITYGFSSIFLGEVLNKSIAQTMVGSLVLNLMMIYAIIQYICMQRNITKVLHITEMGILTTTVVVVLMSIGTITQGRLANGTEMNANTLSMLCVYGFILTLYLKKQQIISTKNSFIRMAIYAISVMLTGSRKGIIMLVIAILVINMVGGSRKLIKTVMITSASAIAIYILIMNVPVLYNIIGIRVENLIVLLTEGSTTEGSLNSRQALTEIGMGYIVQKPWVGYGFDCFKLISGMNGQGKVAVGTVGYYSHNNYIELLFGGGIVGFILYYVPIFVLFVKLVKRRSQDACSAYLLAIFVAKHAVEYAYVSYYARLDAYIIAIILGCVMVMQKYRVGETGEQENRRGTVVKTDIEMDRVIYP